MNKIVLDKEEVIVVDDDLDILVSKEDSKTIYLCSQNRDVCINYQVEEGSHLTVFHYDIDGRNDIKIHLVGQGASIQYFYSTISEKDNSFRVEVFHEASKTKSNVISHGVNVKDASLLFDIYPYVLKNSDDCICNQENRILNLGEGESTVRPNLLIDNYNVVSNHSAYIGAFSDDSLFYLMSRGLSRNASYEILIQSFLVRDVEWMEKIFPEFLEKLKEL